MANGFALQDPKSYEDFVRSLKVGDKVILTVFRDGKTFKVDIILPERPILFGDLPPEDRRIHTPKWDQ